MYLDNNLNRYLKIHKVAKTCLLLMTQSPYFPLRQHVWVLLLQNPSDHQTWSTYGYVGF